MNQFFYKFSKIANTMSHQYYEENEAPPEVGTVINGYKLDKMIDNTKNSAVYVAICPKNNEKVALKMIKCRESNIERVKSELHLLQCIKSPYIIRTKEIFDFPPYKCVVMPLAIGDFHVLLDKMKDRKLPEDTVKKIMRSALLALKYLHSMNICHRDIKPDNFLLLGEEEDEQVQLADLGFAKEFRENELCNEYLGTLNYAAPEVIRGTPYDKSVDIWSMGVSMYKLLSGQPPFPVNPESTLRRCIMNGAFFFPANSWGNISKDAKDLISHMIKVKPNERYTADQCLHHKWFNEPSMPKSKSWTCLSGLVPNTV